MYVERIKSRRGEKVYEQILLRESYREPGAPRSKVKHRTLINLTHCDPKEIAAIEMGLKYKDNLSGLKDIAPGKVNIKQGPSAGAVWALWRVAQKVGLVGALGGSQQGRLVLWQVFARAIDQSSRLSAVRLAREHAACEVLGLESFTEDDLYDSMNWLDARQAKIEGKLFKKRHQEGPPQLFLYDVTSSYLEGTQNAYGAYGYNRDGKRGKLQIVVGLLTNADGVPLSVEVFEGNTQDPKTVLSQIRKMADRFGARDVTLVGDRGMLKSAQIEQLSENSFHYLTAITKPQIESLIKVGVLQLDMFEEKIFEASDGDVRYILRRNPVRAREITDTRDDKFRCVRMRAAARNAYLAKHPRAHVEVALRDVKEYAEKLRIDGWVKIGVEGSEITIERDELTLEQISRLDGCYALKTDVSPQHADAEQLHDRYKDLAQVERAFRSMKTGHLQIRPVYVRTAAHTRAHVFVVMLAYLIRRELEDAWRRLDITVEEGIKQLSALCADEVTIGDRAADKSGYLTVPEPRESLMKLFAAANISPPTTLPRTQSKVATKRKLPSRRKKLTAIELKSD